MSPFDIHAAVGIACAIIALGYIVIANKHIGSAALAAALSGGFLAFSALTIWQDGFVEVWTNHTANLWGVQVWWDLLFAVCLAFFFIAPRARKVGMNVPLWALFVAATASIGLLAMCARLFWLEQALTASQGDAQKPSFDSNPQPTS